MVKGKQRHLRRFTGVSHTVSHAPNSFFYDLIGFGFQFSCTIEPTSMLQIISACTYCRCIA